MNREYSPGMDEPHAPNIEPGDPPRQPHAIPETPKPESQPVTRPVC